MSDIKRMQAMFPRIMSGDFQPLPSSVRLFDRCCFLPTCFPPLAVSFCDVDTHHVPSSDGRAPAAHHRLSSIT